MEEAIREEFGEDLVVRPEFRVINDLLQDPDVSPTEAVQRLLRVRENLHHGQEPPSEIDGNHTWFTMLVLVEIINLTPPAKQRKLVEFIAELQRVDLTDPSTGQSPTAIELKLWTELPYLELYLADMYGFRFKAEYARQVDEDPQTEYPPSKLQEWENRNAFMAQLTAMAAHLRHPMDVSLYALYSCRSAFEQGPLIEEAVRTACIWYIHAGQRVWENCQTGREYGDDDDPPPRRRFSMDKWRIWKDGLKAAQLEFPRESTQEMIRTALGEMEKAERGE
ncbi:hypothetical protein BO85DRAFT_387763 [Aspergillus piperis CBS 112811]|uniref:Uncharacterized protein n=1 Tax=Aspergillus piperis CBS 112811 TaxID=1448313 RepID=A0A8G1RB55_9EURO|nr:hypothetical protein BO85DRAFT_387763 [Aspergillus piperis CBS 112811]RAH63431.1 hypothetical protein BO85DRAFT_387763 [Aspergillus piperis CBS 112811]